jgi:hypothetical protein
MVLSKHAERTIKWRRKRAKRNKLRSLGKAEADAVVPDDNNWSAMVAKGCPNAPWIVVPAAAAKHMAGAAPHIYRVVSAMR